MGKAFRRGIRTVGALRTVVSHLVMVWCWRPGRVSGTVVCLRLNRAVFGYKTVLV